MEDLKEFNISFVGLKLGKHKFEYQINNTFFEYFQYDEFQDSAINVVVNLEKKGNMLNLEFISDGSVTVACDVTNEPFELAVEGNLPIIVKFGDEFNNDNEELLILSHGTFELNVAQLIFEMIVLSMPTKRIHPGVEDGTLQSDVLKKLEEYKEKKTEIDPRWAKLKEIQTNKNIE
ncbi:MAG: hypothetical protein COB73_03240 [Flavobacteriaceae bacterium]|nr:MAG: hypothetical protein COB73_03240 [Flavobacteriaceae bacterium]